MVSPNALGIHNAGYSYSVLLCGVDVMVAVEVEQFVAF